MITDREIKAADIIITYASITEMEAHALAPHVGGNFKDIENAAQYLEEDGLIKIYRMGGWSEKYKCTAKGLELRQSGKKYAEYLKEKSETEKKKQERDELDWRHKLLQIEDLETKLDTMNIAQLDFWKEQKARNKHLTIIAIISAAFSIIAFLKSYGILGGILKTPGSLHTFNY